MHLPGETVAHGLEDGHEVAGQAGAGVQVLGDRTEAKRLQLPTQRQGAECVLGHIGTVHAVNAVGPKHALLLTAPLHQAAAHSAAPLTICWVRMIMAFGK